MNLQLFHFFTLIQKYGNVKYEYEYEIEYRCNTCNLHIYIVVVVVDIGIGSTGKINKMLCYCTKLQL